MPHAAQHHEPGRALRIIRNIYLYLVAMIGLVVFLFGVVGMANNVLKNYVFNVNDYYWVDPFGGGPCEQPTVKVPETGETQERTPEEIALCEERLQEQNERNRRNEVGRELSINIAQIVVGLPVWLFHWGIIQREYRRKKEKKS